MFLGRIGIDMESPVKKNQEYVVDIVGMGSEGQGIGKLDDFTVFVLGAITGETVKVKMLKVKKNFAYGKIVDIINKSDFRVKPPCPVAGRCGGCSLQHMTYEAQLSFKTKRVKDCIERIGRLKCVDVLPTIGMDKPFHYRNKAQFPVSVYNGRPVIGFYAKRSHNVVECDNCLLQHSVNAEIVRVFKSFLTENNISIYDEKTHKGIVRHIVTRVGFVTGEVMVCVVINGEKLPHVEMLVEELIKIEGMTGIVININREKTNVILGKKTKTVWGKGYIEDYIGKIKFNISPLSFFQVNPAQTRVLYEKAVELAKLSGNENVLDIYCGIGTISIFMAQKAKSVLGVEIVDEAIEDAKKNAAENSVENVKFRLGAAEDIIPILHNENFSPDVVVVDPPRKGCDEKVLNTIAEMRPQKIVYISCEPATLARDLKFLTENGFSVNTVQPVDQFANTVSIEVVVLLTCEKSE